MENDREEKPVRHFYEQEGFWFAVVVVAAVVALLVAFGGLVHVFGGKPGTTIIERVDTYYKLMLVLAGFVTFSTIVWRGLIAARQAETQLESTRLQREQIDRLSEQITATKENNLAQLLQKGSELIAEKYNPAHVTAGIATLRFVATAENGNFAVEAMNLLAEYLEREFGSGHGGKLFASANAALKAGEEKGRIAERDIVFSCEDEEITGYPDDQSNWHHVYGVRSLRYFYGDASSAHLLPDGRGAANAEYCYVTIGGGEVSIDDRFRRCDFSRVKVVRVAGDSISENSFRRCDFSNALIYATKIPDLRPGENFFSPSEPPRCGQQLNWPEFLLDATPTELFPF
ncbi:hypothetical protein [Chelativorans sp. YIM 93263]|uniref:hypothetical protein n=1 Tax=Chelativorans sp. YIM 93263 TaxID=2906648 RepID=UPI00237920F0|nr:hypothetical protein [Chelativorans sp. YIM 93263]